jgi:GTP-binding protein
MDTLDPCGQLNLQDKLLILHAAPDYSDCVGRIAIVRIISGKVSIGDDVSACKPDGTIEKTKISQLYMFKA